MPRDLQQPSPNSSATRELLAQVGMLDRGDFSRSNPLLDPAAFEELARRLEALIDAPYDFIVTRNLTGDKILGYQLSLLTGKPVVVSLEREGLILLDREGSLTQGHRALIVADLHFTPHSIRAASAGLKRSGFSVAGLALLMKIREGEYDFPVWSLESS